MTRPSSNEARLERILRRIYWAKVTLVVVLIILFVWVMAGGLR